MGIEIIGESYSNIMPHTFEFTEKMSKKIHPAFLDIRDANYKMMMNTLSKDVYDWLEKTTTPIRSYEIFRYHVSKTMIYIMSCGSLKILGKNRFNNIWLYDKRESMSASGT